MNCCNDFGECTRGHDCPARLESAGPAVTYRTGSKRLDSVLQAVSRGVAVLGVVCVVAAVIATIGLPGGMPR